MVKELGVGWNESDKGVKELFSAVKEPRVNEPANKEVSAKKLLR